MCARNMCTMVLPCGKFIGLLLFCLLFFLLSIFFLNLTYVRKTFSRNELARPVMGTIFLVYKTYYMGQRKVMTSYFMRSISIFSIRKIIETLLRD